MAVSNKQKLFENLVKINPDLQGKKTVVNEAESMQRFLGDLGFADMYYKYKNDPRQLERIFTKILSGNKLSTFKKLLGSKEVKSPALSVGSVSRTKQDKLGL